MSRKVFSILLWSAFVVCSLLLFSSSWREENI